MYFIVDHSMATNGEIIIRQYVLMKPFIYCMNFRTIVIPSRYPNPHSLQSRDQKKEKKNKEKDDLPKPRKCNKTNT